MGARTRSLRRETVADSPRPSTVETDRGDATAVADFEPVLSRNWNVPDSHTLKVYESRGRLSGRAARR